MGNKKNWNTSKGQWGIFGTHSGSEAGKKARDKGAGTDKEANQIKESADGYLKTLLSQFNRSAGTGDELSTYQKQMDLDSDAAGVEEDSFLAEADRKSEAIRENTTSQTKAIETQTAQTGFAGSGTTGRAREDLAKSILTKGRAVYADLGMKMGAQDIEMDKKKLGAETELQNELDRIQGEASTIISQANTSLGGLERKSTESNYIYKPNPGLKDFNPDNVNTDLTIG